MKYSKYNIIFRDNKDNYILANTYTGSIFKINEELKGKIDSKQIDILDKDVIDDYIKTGIIIREDFDELQTLIYGQNIDKFKSKVLSLTILLTTDCNLRCSYCFEGLEKEKNYLNDITRNSIYKFIENMINSNNEIEVISITLFGGEPLMKFEDNYRFFENIKKLCEDKQKRFVTNIVTNGTLITEKHLKFLKDINCMSIQITLDGLKKEHDKKRIYSNNVGTFDKIIKNIKKVLDYKELGSPVIRINIDKGNIEGIPSLIKYLSENNMNSCKIDFGIIRNVDNIINDNSICFKENEIARVLLNLWRELDKFNYLKTPIRRNIYCGMYSDKAFTIMPNADVYKCWEMVNNKKFKIGHINNEGNLVDIGQHIFDWSNRGIESIEDCKECNFLPLCGCGCASVSYQTNKNIFTKGCARTKSILKEQLINMLYEKV